MWKIVNQCAVFAADSYLPEQADSCKKFFQTPRKKVPGPK